MLQISSIYKGDLKNLKISNFLDKTGAPQDGMMVPFYECGEEWQMILDSGGYNPNWWLESKDKIPKGLYLGKALIKVNLYGGTLMFPAVPELGGIEKNQRFGLPGVTLKRKHSSIQFVKFDLWRLLLPPKIKISLKKTKELLAPFGSLEIDKDILKDGVRWQGMMNYTGLIGDADKKMFCPVFTWELSDFLPDMLEVEYQDQTVLLVNKHMKIIACYEQGRYFQGIPDHLTSINTDVFSQIALEI